MITTVVRGFGYGITHTVTVPESALEPASWPGPNYPFTAVRTPVVARCGNRVRSCQPCVIVMEPGTPVTCRHCQRITGIQRQPEPAATGPN